MQNRNVSAVQDATFRIRRRCAIFERKKTASENQRNSGRFFFENWCFKEKRKNVARTKMRNGKKGGFGIFAIGQDFEEDHF